MPFEVSARTIIQLGRELISSDGVAFYELIKNGFDAQEHDYIERKKASTNRGGRSVTTPESKKVFVRVIVRLPYEIVQEGRQRLDELKKPAKARESSAIARELAAKTDLDAPGGDAFASHLSKLRSPRQIRAALDEAALIEFEDAGHGMSIDDLREVYLRIGTSSRKVEQAAKPEYVFLGEKGIGRLSSMRLGSRLYVETAKRGESHWNVLNIDWRVFDRETDKLLQEIPADPEEGEERSDSAKSRTLIRISALRDLWTEDKLRDIASKELSRFVDPFAEVVAHEVYLKFNRQAVGIPPINTLLFEQAHAIVSGELSLPNQGGPIFKGNIDFRQYRRTQPVTLKGVELRSVADVDSDQTLTSLGPFSFIFYWFNRQALLPVEGIGNKRAVQKLVNEWSGGLLLYRDAIRVPPYGGHDDDWLGLDPRALASGGYKINRSQVVGKVDISGKCNPTLVDQTNREGLQDNREKHAFVSLLSKFITENFRSFMDTIAEEYSLQHSPTVGELSDNFDRHRAKLRQHVNSLKRVAAENPDLELESLAREFNNTAIRIRKTLTAARGAQENIDRRRDRLVDLAGLGLLADVIAHELNRSLVHALKGVTSAARKSPTQTLRAQLRSAEAQLKTLQKRVSVLDRLATSGRQRKSRVTVCKLIEAVLDGRHEQFGRHHIAAQVSVKPRSKKLRIHFVEGMLYQIVENLFENSVYWLKEEKKFSPSFSPSITICVDAKSSCLYFSDNGPGIDPENAQRVFAPFFTLKRGRHGKGLGLYISQELAADQGAQLSLSTQSERPDGRLNTFILDFSDILVADE